MSGCTFLTYYLYCECQSKWIYYLISQNLANKLFLSQNWLISYSKSRSVFCCGKNKSALKSKSIKLTS